MEKLLKPKWILYVAVLPVLLMFMLIYSDYYVIETMLSEKVRKFWMLYSGILLMLTVIHLFAAVWFSIKKVNTPFVYALFSFVTHTIFLTTYLFNYEDFFQVTIPRWMMNTEPLLYVVTFLMPQLAWSFMAIVMYITPKPQAKDTWINLGIAVIIPAALYTLGQIALPLLHSRIDVNPHLMVVLFVMVTIAFLLFLTRAAYIFFQGKNVLQGDYQILIKLILTLLLPLLGLSANSGRLLGDFEGEIAIFGDFDSAPFYLLAVLNGILLSIPNTDRKHIRLLLFVARGITFAFSLYFFLVFLPFLPFSLAAVLAFGLGFLMLTPLLVFLLHLMQLNQDFIFLKNNFKSWKLWIMMVAATLVLPTAITLNYLKQRNELQQALHYVYTPDYDKTYKPDYDAILNTLNFVEKNKERQEQFLFTRQQPFLSGYYNLLVLDNLTLSDHKIEKLRNVFSSDEGDYAAHETREETLQLQSLKGSSEYLPGQNAWKSTLSIEMKRASSDEETGFCTYFRLPDGVYADAYSLKVGNEMKSGILAERKAALWVFRQIQTENRDPGILYYTSPNELCLRVFPFSANEVRKTQISFLHREPFTLRIRNQEIKLGEAEKEKSEPLHFGGATYIPAQTKQTLPQVKSQYQYCLLLDAHEKEFFPENIKAAEAWLKQNPGLKNQTRLYQVGTIVREYSASENWQEAMLQNPCEGSYFTGRAQTQIYRNIYKNNIAAIPVFIMCSLTPYRAVNDDETKKWEGLFPQTWPLLHCKKDGKLINYSFEITEDSVPEIPFDITTLKPAVYYEYTDTHGRKHYLPNNAEPSLLLTDSAFTLPSENLSHNWQSGMLLQAAGINNLLAPHLAAAGWSNQVKQSFAAHILTEQTAFMVMETEAQMRALLRKQQEMLRGRASLDAGEEPQAMSEPSLYLMLTLFTAYLLYIRYRKQKYVG